MFLFDAHFHVGVDKQLGLYGSPGRVVVVQCINMKRVSKPQNTCEMNWSIIRWVVRGIQGAAHLPSNPLCSQSPVLDIAESRPFHCCTDSQPCIAYIRKMMVPSRSVGGKAWKQFSVPTLRSESDLFSDLTNGPSFQVVLIDTYNFWHVTSVEH
jgi:hypothetical protein